METNALLLKVRLRPDLRWSRYTEEDEGLWIAQNPIDSEFYFFDFLEMSIAMLMDGKRTLAQIVELGKALDPNIDPLYLQKFIARLDSASLLLHNSVRHEVTQPALQRGLHLASSIAGWRLPLWNPSSFLMVTERFGKLVFQKWTLRCVLALSLICIVLVGQRWPDLIQDIESFRATQRGDRWLFTLGILVAIKGLHELGHAMACHAMGGKCHEVGVLFFLMAPSLYCDVSDMWKSPSRWKRIAVSAAGVYVELILALIATVVWWNSTVPWVHGLAVQVMVLCTLMTIFVNANPLLRYDGYFVLSDILRVPNLSDQSHDAWLGLWRPSVGSWQQRWSFRKLVLAAYHVASSSYRLLLLMAITWSINAWFFQFRLIELGRVILALMLLAMTARWWSRILLDGRIRWRAMSSVPFGSGGIFAWAKFMVVTMALAWLIWLGGSWRMQQSVIARGILEPAGWAPLYARHSGILTFVATNGSRVEPDQVVVRIVSPEMDLERLKLQGDLVSARVRRDQLLTRAVDDPLAAQQSLELERSILALEERFEKLQSEAASLSMRSHGTGRFETSESTSLQSDLSGRNHGERIPHSRLAQDRPAIQRGDMLGKVVTNDRWQVKAMVTEREIESIAVGAIARIRLDQGGKKTCKGKVQTIAAERLAQTPLALQGDSLFVSISTRNEVLPAVRPEQVTYAVIIELEQQSEQSEPWIENGLATVRIDSNGKTVFEYLREFLTW